ncbi:MAG: putative LPS assembly protein LptD [bacterium]|nr:putative LPS assembly protein LptD [bacterium]
MLISLSFNHLNAQTQGNDTLKKVSADTLVQEEESKELEEQIVYTAEDSVVALPGKGKVLLYGKSKVTYGTMDMQAEYIEINYTRNIISAYGKKDSLGKNVGTPVFKDGSDTPMEAEKIMYNLRTKKGKIYNALTHQGELLVIGNEIKKDSTNVIYMKDMRCIPCGEEDARTVFRASKAKIIPNDKIVTGPMYLEIGGVPTPLGLPFGYFPNTKKQHNGILLPTFGASANQGYFLKQGGYYWGINDKTEMFIRGDIYTNGSYRINTENNYNVLYKARGALLLSFTKFNSGDKDIPTQYFTQKSYDVQWRHSQDNKSNPSVRFSADVNYHSNQSLNRLNGQNSQQFLQNQFQSNVSFSKTFKLSSLSINALQNQNSQTRQMSIVFPSLTFNVNSFFPFKNETRAKQNVIDKIRVYYLLEASNKLNGADTSIFKGNFLDSLNYGVSQKLPISTCFNILKYITATPALNLSSVMYTKSIEKEFYLDNIGSKDKERDSSIGKVRTNTVKGFEAAYEASFSTALKTQVYFDYMFRKGKIKQIRHLLIPSLNYLYRPDFGEPKYGYWKKVQTDTAHHMANYSIFEKSIYGGPGIGKQNSLGIDLNNNLEAKIKHTSDTGTTYKKVVLLQNLGLSGNYNFAADSFKTSQISLTARTKVLKYFDIVAGSSFDPYHYNKELGRRVSVYAVSEGGPVARMVNANFSINTTIGSNMLKALSKTREAPKMSSGAERGIESDLESKEKLPWNLSIYYTLGLTNPDASKFRTNNNLRFSGDIKPTKYWKVGVSSGFDFLTQRLSYTRFSVYRDLKCWQAQIDWVPFGVSKMYMITLNMKTSMLSEFKIPRTRQWYDTF